MSNPKISKIKVNGATYDIGNSSIETWNGYPCQVVSLQPGDVLLVHVNDDLDLDNCRTIMKELNEAFPNNHCLLSNEHVLKGFTILRDGFYERINPSVEIGTGIDIDKMFESIEKEYKNDFLY